jgi:hypothetical protein
LAMNMMRRRRFASSGILRGRIRSCTVAYLRKDRENRLG